MGHSDEWTFADYFKYEKEIYRAIISAAVLCQWIAEHDTPPTDGEAEELVREIGVIFRDDLFKDSAGEYIKMNVYEQNLPIRQDEDAPDPIPYVIVRVETGQAKGGVEPQEVFVTLLIGYFDDDAGNNGHKGVLGIIQKIQERFMKEPMLAKQFYFMNDEQHPFDWALQDEESFPYFFGAASMTFATAAIRKEDRFA